MQIPERSYTALFSMITHSSTRCKLLPLTLSAFCQTCVAYAVMKQGEIVEQGSHRELMQNPQGAYATLVRLQASAQHILQDPVHPFDQKAKESNQLEVVQAYSTLQVCQVAGLMFAHKC